jgi:2-polyprenyl-6-methoxyphenol hydroxylase-like FAD-dependent oxidoreductase
MTLLSSLRIAIVGAGPGGLTLARLLHLHDIRAELFERDAHRHDRPQGGTLDLHEDSGMLALRRAGLWDGFLQVARYEDQGDKLVDKSGALLFETTDSSDGNRPEVDRTALRDLLLDALPENCVHWGGAVQGVVDHGDATWSLQCEGRTYGPYDLIVGADGAWSRIRPLLSRYQPQYSGLTLLEFGIDDVDNAHPEVAALVGRGKVGVQGDAKGIIAQRNGNSHVRGYAVLRVPQGWVEQRFDFNSPAAVRAGLIKEYAGFDDSILALFAASNDHFAPRYIVALPVGHHWPHRPGLTLLGDAAHVMSPWGGDGVNNAMQDALALAEAIASGGDLSKSVATYEAQMFERIEPSVKRATDAAAVQLSHDGQAIGLERVRRIHAQSR